MNTQLLVIDPQNSFCSPAGELYVADAENDMQRLATFVSANTDKLDKITITLDSHNKVHISHPVWWIDKKGNNPEPYTAITKEDVKNGIWASANPALQDWSMSYLEKVNENIVWPYHCLIGTWGHNVFNPLNMAVSNWAEERNELEYIIKGTSKFTESFSAVKTLVEVPDDSSTGLNMALINSLDESDTIVIAGEASSHCVAETVKDLLQAKPDIGKKLILLEDAMSPVTGFEKISDDFFREMKDNRIRISTTEELY